MTYYGSKELAASFRTVRANTIKMAEEIPEDKYDFRPTPESRSVAQTLVHVAVSVKLQQLVHFTGEPLNTLVGLDFFALMGAIIAEEQKPRTKAEILELLKTEGEKFATQLEGCTEEFLAQSVQYPEGMMPPTKSRFEMVMAPKEHEMHHRGQLMLVQRMIGLTPHLTRQMQERVAAMAAAQKA
ncbi:MAG TPA: DinB family protein [Candidatus Acidoferrum sp.]|jgi:uncharacterized damage-inducible protein DinB|nr:DinB family protein [Candidatus Acidoferrum sp.]